MFSAMLVEHGPEDNGKLVAQVRQLVVAQINAVQLDLTSGMQAGQQVQSVVSCARPPAMPTRVPGGAQKEMSQDMVVLASCEGDVVEGHTTRGTRDRFLLLDDIRRLVKKGRSSLSTGQ